MNSEKLLRLSTAADRLTIRPRTVKEWIRTGKLRGVRLANGHWRVPETEVERAQKITSSN